MSLLDECQKATVEIEACAEIIKCHRSSVVEKVERIISSISALKEEIALVAKKLINPNDTGASQ